MASYYINEAVFELPERRFVDKTIHGLEAKLPSGKTLCVFVQRRLLDKPSTLSDLVAENIALNKKRLLGFVAVSEREISVGGIAGVEVRTEWRDRDTVFYQRQAHVVLGEQLMIVAVSAPRDEQIICDQTFGEIVESITWRAD